MTTVIAVQPTPSTCTPAAPLAGTTLALSCPFGLAVPPFQLLGTTGADGVLEVLPHSADALLCSILAFHPDHGGSITPVGRECRPEQLGAATYERGCSRLAPVFTLLPSRSPVTGFVEGDETRFVAGTECASACPDQAPAEGAACRPSKLDCRYPDDTHARCTDGAFHLVRPDDGPAMVKYRVELSAYAPGHTLDLVFDYAKKASAARRERSGTVFREELTEAVCERIFDFGTGTVRATLRNGEGKIVDSRIASYPIQAIASNSGPAATPCSVQWPTPGAKLGGEPVRLGLQLRHDLRLVVDAAPIATFTSAETLTGIEIPNVSVGRLAHDGRSWQSNLSGTAEAHRKK